MADTIELKVLVIGAGISGIAAAKFYLDIHPDSRLVILERDTCVGGTWNSRRGYDSFWTQWTVGTAEFSDQPMARPPDEDLYYEFFRAKHTTKYLETYVDSHSYANRSLRDRIKLSVEVKSVLKRDGMWNITATQRQTGSQHIFRASKLIVDSGLTSIPNLPLLPGRENFSARILHHDNFGSSKILTSPDVQNVTILGAGKSSADMAYEAVKSGKNVTWILKDTDTTGPGFFLSPKGKGPYENAFEVGMTRLAGSFSPSFMNGINGWTSFLHSSKFGVRMMGTFWNTIDIEARKEAKFDRKLSKGFEQLAPHSPIFWQNCTGGLLNHEDFFDTIAENVTFYTGKVTSLGNHRVLLNTGDEVSSDALLCGTGWVASHLFFSENQCRELGLPYEAIQGNPEEKKHWSELEAEADKKVLNTFPQLADPPSHYEKSACQTAYRLYRNIVPLCESTVAEGDRSIVFIGHVGVGNYFRAVECQSMWATAYFDGKLELPSAEEQEKEIALFTAWNRRRYLSKGQRGNTMIFELIGYTDTLLRDMGLSSHLKGWFKDIFATCWARDLKNLKPEFIAKFGYDGVV